MVGDITIRREFSRRVSRLREQRELTQAELGRMVGVSGTCVWNWEGSNTFPRPGTMRRLAQALGTTVDFLNGDSRDTPETDNQSVPQRSLSDVIFAAREQVAIAAGVPVRKVRMIIDCGD